MFNIFSDSPQVASFGCVSTIEMARESVECYQEMNMCREGSVIVSINTNPIVVATFCGEYWEYNHDNLHLYYDYIANKEKRKKISLNTIFQRSLRFINRLRTSYRVRYNNYVNKIQRKI